MKKISQFPQITECNNDDWLLIEEASTGAFKKIKVSNFVANLGGSTIADPLLSDIPTAFWKLNETSGSPTALDSGNSILNGSYINGTVGETAPGTLARCFNTANNGHVRVLDNTTLRFTNAFSIEAWIQLNNTTQTNTYLLSKENDYALLYGFVNQTIELFSNTATVRAGTQITLNNPNWNHIAYTYNGSTLIGYLNGAQVLSVAKSFSLPTSTSYFTIGATYASGTTVANQSNSKIARVALFNYALSAARIQAHYQSVSLT